MTIHELVNNAVSVLCVLKGQMSLSSAMRVWNQRLQDFLHAFHVKKVRYLIKATKNVRLLLKVMVKGTYTQCLLKRNAHTVHTQLLLQSDQLLQWIVYLAI